MRQIKFRAWEKDRRIWHYLIIHPKGKIQFLGEPEYKTPDDCMAEYEVSDVQQSTGLLDKNGKEIYEGDVIKTTMGNEKVEMKDNTYDDGSCYGYDGWTYQDCEVIGNIHENPDLIK